MNEKDLRRVAAARDRIARVLTAATMFAYFGFILLVAWGKPLLGHLLTSGLSLGMLLGSLVIVLSWVFTGIYVSWANRHYDVHVERLAGKSKRGGGT
ncbi:MULTISPECIES: DUF485 domain-containing protein [Polyangium]|uniref:DUF485 domain-containing protein n=2 Tax=Polyangium TaxID=55 RepID=A0A4U1JGM4_9BACT|nr:MULTISPECIES: DUF485 domain-containing protein [Polyangium]MDI1430011.1 DUF485 domain-containing protein [Polyangium sorediatum]TKD09788.1 DUF485 domain-containing protein [Polyangium fumosum]